MKKDNRYIKKKEIDCFTQPTSVLQFQSSARPLSYNPNLSANFVELKGFEPSSKEHRCLHSKKVYQQSYLYKLNGNSTRIDDKTTGITPAANSTYKKLAVQCSADTFVVNQSLVHRINICGENRQLLVAANRYLQV